MATSLQAACAHTPAHAKPACGWPWLSTRRQLRLSVPRMLCIRCSWICPWNNIHYSYRTSAALGCTRCFQLPRPAALVYSSSSSSRPSKLQLVCSSQQHPLLPRAPASPLSGAPAPQGAGAALRSAPCDCRQPHAPLTSSPTPLPKQAGWPNPHGYGTPGLERATGLTAVPARYVSVQPPGMWCQGCGAR